MPSCPIEPARTREHWREVRRLFEEYADGLGFDLGFQDFARELARLPGDYAEPGGCALVARRAGEPVGSAYSVIPTCCPGGAMSSPRLDIFLRAEITAPAADEILHYRPVISVRRLDT